MWEGNRCQSVCLPRRCPLPPRAACPPAAVINWLSSSKEMAKQGTVYLCRLYSLHIPAAGLWHHSNLPGSAKKGSADLLSTTVCREVPGGRSIGDSVPALSNIADPTIHPPQSLVLSIHSIVHVSRSFSPFVSRGAFPKEKMSLVYPHSKFSGLILPTDSLSKRIT